MTQTLQAGPGENLLEQATATPATRPDWGWVEAEPNQLRPAYRRPNGVIVYSPDPHSPWQEAPRQIAATWLLQHLGSEDWRPFTTPDGMQVVDYPRRPPAEANTRPAPVLDNHT